MMNEKAIDETTRVRLLKWGIDNGTNSRGGKRGRIRRVTSV